MQVLINATGFDPTDATPEQIASLEQSLEHLGKDPRVQHVYGTTGHSIGCTMFCEVSSLAEAEQLAGYLRISGWPAVEVIPVVSRNLFAAGLEQARKAAVTRQAPAEISPSRAA
ncbi:MAG: hypothetical protein HY683_05685 [Chloroflexi bacterium]|nr:hypothetical protein [Chloroflexota bacterium]